MFKHDLFLELDMFCPVWQTRYRTIADAAKAAKVMPMYSEWLGTAEGKRYHEVMVGVADTVEANEQAKKLRDEYMQRSMQMRARYAD